MTKIITISLLVFFTVLIAFLSAYWYKKQNRGKTLKFSGLGFHFWNIAVVIGMGLTALALLLFK